MTEIVSLLLRGASSRDRIPSRIHKAQDRGGVAGGVGRKEQGEASCTQEAHAGPKR